MCDGIHLGVARFDDCLFSPVLSLMDNINFMLGTASPRFQDHGYLQLNSTSGYEG